ncbi:MAG TPA: nodulation protein NfeD [Thermoanaerobaculia bacterium]|nr:nodulation protein NfeD [Thermoanaerobaculia bacterium]
MRLRRALQLPAIAAALLLGPAGAGKAGADAARPLVVEGRIDTAIHPAAANYLAKLIRGAEKDGAAVVIVGISTPGGLLTSTREMATAILQSKVPVVTYVSPSGSSAASAGFFLLMAGDVAAMAPGTNTGAAHPVAGEGQELPKTLNEKAEQDSRAFIRSLAHERGRDADRAESAVTSSKSFTETEAKEGKLVEIIARDVPDLVGQLDGRTVRRVGEKETVLHLKNYRLETREMNGLEKALGVVSHPNVAYILFLLGLVGLYFEMSSPGAVLPGIVGGIALLLALYAFSVLPVNFAGIALILFAVLLFVLEIKAATHGLLAAGGAISLLVGSLLLFSGRGETGYRVDLGIVLPAVLMTLAVLGFLTFRTISLRRAPVRTGSVSLVGRNAKVVRASAESDEPGTVLLDGEYWDAYGAPGAPAGENVRVVGVEGLKLRVERRVS